MTYKEKVRQRHPRAYAERFRTHGGKGYTLIWAKRQQEQRLASGDTAAEAWRTAWKNIETELRRVAALKMNDEVTLARMEKTLEECGWRREDCGRWEDPITGLHEPTSRAYEIANQRRAGVTPSKH